MDNQIYSTMIFYFNYFLSLINSCDLIFWGFL